MPSIGDSQRPAFEAVDAVFLQLLYVPVVVENTMQASYSQGHAAFLSHRLHRSGGGSFAANTVNACGWICLPKTAQTLNPKP